MEWASYAMDVLYITFSRSVLTSDWNEIILITAESTIGISPSSLGQMWHIPPYLMAKSEDILGVWLMWITLHVLITCPSPSIRTKKLSMVGGFRAWISNYIHVNNWM